MAAPMLEVKSLSISFGGLKAVDSFDPGKGIRLSSYASKCIENGILT